MPERRKDICLNQAMNIQSQLFQYNLFLNKYFLNLSSPLNRTVTFDFQIRKRMLTIWHRNRFFLWKISCTERTSQNRRVINGKFSQCWFDTKPCYKSTESFILSNKFVIRQLYCIKNLFIFLSHPSHWEIIKLNSINDH